MFLGLGATLLACFNFTGNVTHTGLTNQNISTTFYKDYKAEDIITYSTSFDLTTIDYSVTNNAQYYLTYENAQYQYLNIGISRWLGTGAKTIGIAQPGTLSSSNTASFNFNIYLCAELVDSENDTTTYQYHTFGYVLHESSGLWFINDIEDIDSVTIYFTIVPYNQSDYNILTGSDAVTYAQGYDKGYEDGYSVGSRDTYDDAFGVGYDSGYEAGETDGYSTGWNDGYLDGQQTDSKMNTIFANIFQVGMIPVNFFLAILNFEVFGINIASIVSALLTIAIVVIVIKTIFGGKSSD